MPKTAYRPPVVWSRAAALGWLQRLWGSRDWSRLPADPLLQLIWGAAQCRRLGVRSAGRLLTETAGALEGLWGENRGAVLGAAQPLWLVLARQALAAAGHAVPALDAAAGQIEAELAGAPAEAWQHPAVLLLGRLLDLPGADVAAHAPTLLPDAADVLLLDTAGLMSQCDLWGAATCLGREPVPAALVGAALELEEVLPAVMLAECRNYQLDVAAGLLRVMAWLRHDRLALAEGADFLAFQQREDGSFGFLNPLAPGYDSLPADRELAIHLPFTVEILWALAETAPVGRRKDGGRTSAGRRKGGDQVGGPSA